MDITEKRPYNYLRRKKETLTLLGKPQYMTQKSKLYLDYGNFYPKSNAEEINPSLRNKYSQTRQNFNFDLK